MFRWSRKLVIMKILITGTSSGIGRELARQLAEAGHQVWGIARRKDLLESLRHELGGDEFHYSQGVPCLAGR